MRWFRLWENLLDNAKVQGLDPATFRTWVNVLCAAARFQSDGSLPAIKPLAFWLRSSESEVLQRLETLVSEGLVDQLKPGRFSVHDWDHWQPHSDSSTERTRKHKAAKRAKEQPGNNTGTARERSGNVPGTEEERQGNALEQNRTDTDQIRTEERDEFSEELTLSKSVSVRKEICSLSEWIMQATAGGYGHDADKYVTAANWPVASWRAAWEIVLARAEMPRQPWAFCRAVIKEWPGGIPPATPTTQPRGKVKPPPPTPEEEEAADARLAERERQILAQMGRTV